MLGFVKPHRGLNNVWDGQTVAKLPGSDMPLHEYNGVYVLLVLMHTRRDYLFEGMVNGLHGQRSCEDGEPLYK